MIRVLNSLSPFSPSCSCLKDICKMCDPFSFPFPSALPLSFFDVGLSLIDDESGGRKSQTRIHHLCSCRWFSPAIVVFFLLASDPCLERQKEWRRSQMTIYRRWNHNKIIHTHPLRDSAIIRRQQTGGERGTVIKSVAHCIPLPTVERTSWQKENNKYTMLVSVFYDQLFSLVLPVQSYIYFTPFPLFSLLCLSPMCVLPCTCDVTFRSLPSSSSLLFSLNQLITDPKMLLPLLLLLRVRDEELKGLADRISVYWFITLFVSCSVSSHPVIWLYIFASFSSPLTIIGHEKEKQEGIRGAISLSFCYLSRLGSLEERGAVAAHREEKNTQDLGWIFFAITKRRKENGQYVRQRWGKEKERERDGTIADGKRKQRKESLNWSRSPSKIESRTLMQLVSLQRYQNPGSLSLWLLLLTVFMLIHKYQNIFLFL